MELFEKYADLRLLSFFLRNPSGQFYVKELARELDLSPSSVSVATRKFELDEILTSEKRGLEKFYRLNDETPLVRGFKVTYTLVRLQDAKLTERFLAVDPSIISIALYGPYASGTYDEESELNLLALSQKGREKFMKTIGKIEDELELKIMLKAFKLGEWKKSMETSDSSYREVISNHILLFGSDLT